MFGANKLYSNFSYAYYKLVSVSNSLWPHGLYSTRLFIYRILQARILEWVAISFSGGSSQPKGWTPVSCIAGRFFTIWTSTLILKNLIILKKYIKHKHFHNILPKSFKCKICSNSLSLVIIVTTFFYLSWFFLWRIHQFSYYTFQRTFSFANPLLVFFYFIKFYSLSISFLLLSWV